LTLQTIQLDTYSLVSESYTCFDNYLLRIPWYSGNNFASASKIVRWDTAKTKITNAKLRCRAEAEDANRGVRVKFNGNEIVYAADFWTPVKIDETKDVSGMLINGSNEIFIETWKVAPMWSEYGARFWVTLIIEYEGTTPEEEPWWIPIVIGGIVVGGTVLGVAWLLTR